MSRPVPEILVVGAGPAGLAAGIEAASHGVEVKVVDENGQPGGQLLKQTHKFFGSERHYAGMRGIAIATRLFEEATRFKVDVQLNTAAIGIFDGLVVMMTYQERLETVKPGRIILATGAAENAISFPGWTLPGVMTAGAAQTFVNLHRIRVGDRVAVVGSGNVGLIVAYQLRQAGSEIVAVVEAMPRIGGWGVHASKIRRMGIPILPSHTIKEACGEDHVTAVVIHEVDSGFRPVPGTEVELVADTVCLAVGMTPRARLAEVSGCTLTDEAVFGGLLPLHGAAMETTVPGTYVAGDASGIEEASTAIEEGRLAGLAAAYSLGRVSENAYGERREMYRAALDELRSGPFGEERRQVKAQIVRRYEEGTR